MAMVLRNRQLSVVLILIIISAMYSIVRFSQHSLHQGNLLKDYQSQALQSENAKQHFEDIMRKLQQVEQEREASREASEKDKANVEKLIAVQNSLMSEIKALLNKTKEADDPMIGSKNQNGGGAGGKNENENIGTGNAVQPRILVLVMTIPKNHETKAVAVRDTWGKRADKLIFMSSENNASLPAVKVDVPEGREHLLAKTNAAFMYVYEHYFNDYDWFMKADDDTYVIMENLRLLLSRFNASDPLYMGALFQAYVKQGYMSGGAGYVLSKEALRRFYGSQKQACMQDSQGEDLEMGRCMERLGVLSVNTTDAKGLQRMHPLSLSHHLRGTYDEWMFRFDATGARHGAQFVSPLAVSFHYMEPDEMRVVDLLLYRLRAHGVKGLSRDEVMKLSEPQENILIKNGNPDFMKDNQCVRDGNCIEWIIKNKPAWYRGPPL